MTFSVVIPTLGRAEILRDTLASLAACAPPADEIIIVDGDAGRSAEPVVAAAGREHPRLVLRYYSSDPGSTHQRNAGIEAAVGDVVVFLDDDVTVEPSFFRDLATAYDDPEVVGATGRVIEPRSHRVGDQRSRIRRLVPGGAEGTFTRFGYPCYLQDVERPRDVEIMQGCLMTARREMARKVGFDESMTGYAIAEDEDFAVRLSRLGRIRYLPDLVLHHKKLGFGTRDVRAINRVAVVNRAYLFRKNFPQTAPARLQFGLLLLMLLAHRIANRNWAGVRGLLEGLMAARRDPRAR